MKLQIYLFNIANNTGSYFCNYNRNPMSFASEQIGIFSQIMVLFMNKAAMEGDGR